MLSFQNFSNSNTVDIDESVTTFNDLPNSWKKVGAGRYGSLGGPGSKVEVIAQSNKIKSLYGAKKFFKQAMSSNNYELVWIELEGDPLVALRVDSSYTSSRPIVQVFYPQGGQSSKKVYTKASYSGKWSGRLKKYIPPVYNSHVEKNLTKTDALAEVFSVFNKTLEATRDASDLPADTNLWDIAKGLNVEIRGLTPDDERKQKQRDRKAARNVEDAFSTQRKEIITKYVKDKLNPAIEKVKKNVGDQIDAAIAGDGKVDLSGIDTQLKNIQAVTKRLAYIMNKTNVKFSETRYGDNKAKASFDVSYLMDTLKQLDESEII